MELVVDCLGGQGVKGSRIQDSRIQDSRIQDSTFKGSRIQDSRFKIESPPKSKTALSLSFIR